VQPHVPGGSPALAGVAAEERQSQLKQRFLALKGELSSPTPPEGADTVSTEGSVDLDLPPMGSQRPAGSTASGLLALSPAARAAPPALKPPSEEVTALLARLAAAASPEPDQAVNMPTLEQGGFHGAAVRAPASIHA
jgi:hypothetical protein